MGLRVSSIRGKGLPSLKFLVSSPAAGGESPYVREHVKGQNQAAHARVEI